MTPSLATIGNVVFWCLAVLGSWSFFKDAIPLAVRTLRRWQAQHSNRSAQQQALNLAVSLDALSELRNPGAFGRFALVRTNAMLLLAILAITLVGIGLFEAGQQKVASIGGLMVAYISASLFLRTYFQTKSLKNVAITTERVRARIRALGALYPKDELLQHVVTRFEEVYPLPSLATNAAGSDTEGRDLGNIGTLAAQTAGPSPGSEASAPQVALAQAVAKESPRTPEQPAGSSPRGA